MGAVLAGAGRIVAIDLSDEKLGLARQLGATDTVNAKDVDHVTQVRDLTNGGVDYAFDLAGTIKAMETAYLVTRWGGTTVTAACRPSRRISPSSRAASSARRRRSRAPTWEAACRSATSRASSRSTSRQAAGRPHGQPAHRLRPAERGLRPSAGRRHRAPGAGAARLGASRSRLSIGGGGSTCYDLRHGPVRSPAIGQARRSVPALEDPRADPVRLAGAWRCPAGQRCRSSGRVRPDADWSLFDVARLHRELADCSADRSIWCASAM